MIALFALASVRTPAGDELPSRVRPAEFEPSLSMEDAAEYLCSLPKPLGLDGHVSDGVLTLRTDDEELNEFAHGLLAVRKADDGYGWLRERYGDAIDHLEVVCFAAGRYLRARMADLKEFERDYFLGTAGNRSMDFADSRGLRTKGADWSMMIGASAFVHFYSAPDE